MQVVTPVSYGPVVGASGYTSKLLTSGRCKRLHLPIKLDDALALGWNRYAPQKLIIKNNNIFKKN